jgi:Ca2+-binding EF-hand superfamily protein
MALDEERFLEIRHRIEKIFVLYDADKNREWTNTEIRTLISDYRRAMDAGPSDGKIIGKIFKMMDPEGKGAYKLENFKKEFVPIIKTLGEPNSEMEVLIKQAFHDLDLDRSGFLDRGEIGQLLQLQCGHMG